MNSLKIFSKPKSSNSVYFLNNSYFIHELVILSLFCSTVLTSNIPIAANSPTHEIIPSPSPSSISPPTQKILMEREKTVEGVESPSSSKSLFFGEDINGVPIVFGTWFRYGSYTLAFALFGTSFLIACAACGVYYTLFVVTEPSQQESTPINVRSYKNTLEGWDLTRVMRALQLAYETYATFDPYNASCQLKTICEIQEGPQFQGSLFKRLVHFLIHTELVQNKLENSEELRAADRVGNDPRKSCLEQYGECRFSLVKLYESYTKL